MSRTLLTIKAQTKATEDAATAARDSAEAALLNAKALINSERPWLLMKIEPFFGNEEFPTVVAKNCGRTPAKIVFFSDAIPRLRADMPLTPEYGELKAHVTPYILLPDEKMEVSAISEASIKELCGTYEVFGRIEQGKEQAYIFGAIYYQDLLNPPEAALHETRWCCRYFPTSPVKLLMIGPKDYNSHT